MPTFTPAQDIDEVIARLDEVIQWAVETRNPLGIFPALYVVVTEKVKAGIARGDVFQDGPRMERLDVIFANRYLEALHQFRNGEKCSSAWKVAFVIAGRFPTHLILQELLVGMNAHINLDLGIAAAETSPGDAIAGLKKDFYAINAILNALIDDIKTDIEDLSPRIRHILRFMVGEDIIMQFGIKIARDEAWKFATRLAPRSGDAWAAIVDEKDKEAAKLGNIVGSPGWWQNLIIWWVKRKESTDVPQIITLLRDKAQAKVRFPSELPASYLREDD